MKAAKLALLSLLCTAGCNDYTDYYFVGRVYDGAAGTRLTDYKIELQFLDRTLEGRVEDDGRYFVGPLTPFNDYTIAIFADGYRSFLSHNMMKVDDEISFTNNTDDHGKHPDRSQYFDAYLFPTGVVASATTFHISLSDSSTPPSGTVRLRPTTSSSLFDTAAEMPAGVDTQEWKNDDDLQFATVTRDFKDGVLSFAAGDLIFGVTYAVTIYGVPGHAPFEGSYTAGTDGSASFVVTPQANSPLKLAFVSTQLGTPVPSGEVVFVFNQPVELDPLGAPGEYLKWLEQNFSIDSPDHDGDGMVNALKAFDPMAPGGSRGLKATIEGAKLTLSWDPAVALRTTDAGDPIRSVLYGGLNGVVIRPVGGTVAEATSVGALLGSNLVLVPVTP